MIYQIIPFGQEKFDKNYGAACNDFISNLPDDSHILVQDYDTMFPHPSYLALFKNITKKYPNDLITCLTNRVGNRRQCYNKERSENDSIKYHYRIAQTLAERYKDSVIKLPPPISGMCMVFSKALWKQVGGFKDGILTVDNNFSAKVIRYGHRILLAYGIYILHYYRLCQGIADKSHLK